VLLDQAQSLGLFGQAEVVGVLPPPQCSWPSRRRWLRALPMSSRFPARSLQVGAHHLGGPAWLVILAAAVPAGVGGRKGMWT